MKILFRTIILFFLLTCHSYSASIIRDAEIEHVLRSMSDPIFIAAGLTPESINLFIVNDSEINAYVSGGNNIFVNTGLLEVSDKPGVITGVIAHETGHISGGHLFRSSEEYKNTALRTTLGYMMGLAAAAVGSPQAGVAIASGAGHAAKRHMLKHTRIQEEAADQAALSFLNKTNQSAKGLLELLQVLYSRENTLYDDINPYTLTHPLSRERISHVQNHLDNSRYTAVKTNRHTEQAYARIITKLKAFLNPHAKTLEKYPVSDQSINARYARAIAYYKIPDIHKSLYEIDSLIKLQPHNPFFYELKGQILFENGKVKQSIPYYEQAKKLLPNSPLIKIILATAQISSEDDALRKKAINNLEQALLQEKQNIFAWKQLSIAYGRGGELGLSNLALAEIEFLAGRKKKAKKFLQYAKEHINPNSPAALRIEDMLSALNAI